MIFDKALHPQRVEKSTTAQSLGFSVGGGSFANVDSESAKKLSAVYGAIDILSNSMAKLPKRVINTNTRQLEKHPINELLQLRPNDAFNSFDHDKVIMANVLTTGSGYEWIIRRNGVPVELIAVPGKLVVPWRDSNGRVWYDVTNPATGEVMRLHEMDMCRFKGFSEDGFHTKSMISYAADVIGAGLAAQHYERSYYENGGQPSGILMTEADLSGMTEVPIGDGNVEAITKKEAVRREWERVHNGPSNAHRVAILDYGLKYSPIAISQSDAQFVESKACTVEDIARFSGVPLYKLQAGKQSYSSNEQNAIEYVVGAIHPRVTQWEQERSYKLLLSGELSRGLWVHINMMAELKGDTAARGQWYRNMRDIGAFSVNDIRSLEDMPDVPGGDTRYANLNNIPLERFDELSVARNLQNGAMNRE